MKTIQLIILAILLTLLASCEKEVIVIEEAPEVCFYEATDIQGYIFESYLCGSSRICTRSNYFGGDAGLPPQNVIDFINDTEQVKKGLVGTWTVMYENFSPYPPTEITFTVVKDYCLD